VGLHGSGVYQHQGSTDFKGDDDDDDELHSTNPATFLDRLELTTGTRAAGTFYGQNQYILSVLHSIASSTLSAVMAFLHTMLQHLTARKHQ
jgi:hypothetical protein